MDYQHIIKSLEANKTIFESLLKGLTEQEYRWKQNPNKWCALEIICHLHDEEREDFRARVKHVLETPNSPMLPINPVGWVTERKYIELDFESALTAFIHEREYSIEWLKSLHNPKWDNAFHHPKFGALSAKFFLTNWLAHDYLHIRQITRLKYDYLADMSGINIDYAGTWVLQ